jgi:hypothetical protein
MEHASLMMIPGSGLDLRRSLFASKTSSAFVEETADLTEDEELPFAVEDSSCAGSVYAAPSSTPSETTSHPNDVSASAIQFAQRLGKPHTRPTFASVPSGSSSIAPSIAGQSDVDRLAEQLAEFRSFGVSLNLIRGGPSSSSSAVVGVDDSGGGGSSSTNTTSTPISLKT